MLVVYLIHRQHNDYLAHSRYIVSPLILLHKHHKQINFFPQSKALSKPPFLTTTSAPHSLSSKTPAPHPISRCLLASNMQSYDFKFSKFEISGHAVFRFKATFHVVTGRANTGTLRYPARTSCHDFFRRRTLMLSLSATARVRSLAYARTLLRFV